MPQKSKPAVDVDASMADLVDAQGHWVQQEQPEQTAKLIVQFLRDQSPKSATR